MPKKKLVLLYSIIFFITGLVTFLLLHFFLLKQYLWVEILLALNLASFILFGFDKTMATYKNQTRLPEVFFTLIALIGGSAGIVVGSYVFRHKTRKLSFMWKVYVILIIQLAVVMYLMRDSFGF